MQIRVPESIVFGAERAKKSLYKRKIFRFISLEAWNFLTAPENKKRRKPFNGADFGQYIKIKKTVKSVLDHIFDHLHDHN